MQPKALDLFAGCGGLSLGLTRAGFDVIAANEIDQWAADTHRHNNPNVELIQSDIRDIKSEYLKKRFFGQIDLVAGGPPCQGFSVSGKRQYGHVKEQNTLVAEYMRVVAAIRPKVALLENVGGFRTGLIKPGNPVMAYLSEAFAELGYEVSTKLLQAADFGVPSLRSRLFVVASRIGMPENPFPTPTHSGDSTGALLRHVFLWDAIGDLPALNAREGNEGPAEYTAKPFSEFQRIQRRSSAGVWNHVAMKHTPRLVERFSQLPQGGRGYDIGRVGKQSSSEQVTTYKTNNQRLVSEAPSLCITANFQSTYVHPFQPRNLTAREAARLMSYPDSYVFLGKRTQMSSGFLKQYGRENEDYLSQYNQIGNSVPPLLGEAIGRTLIRLIETGGSSQLHASPHVAAKIVEVI